ncbi:MAG: asparagine synthase (glutamine-hydrolyzing) [Bacteroidales bacterium]|nr:asparagine synthase (glutamine-hydrolyzing) [Bacteroidales bacterium]
MCGIFGFHSELIQLTTEEINNIKLSLHHRGPDNVNCFQKNNFTFIHSRLKIIDTSDKANQPLFSASKRYLIVYNGEIYNFKEIKKTYNLKTITNSDTEVLVEFFSKKGNTIWQELNGMFAGAIFDIENNKITLFRDRMGIKPLFYYLDNYVFAFASEIKTLLCCNYIRSNISFNKSILPYYLHLGFVPSPFTAFTNIFKFPSATYAEYYKSNITFYNYWDITNIYTNKLRNEKEILVILKTLIEDAVKSHLVSDVPYGIFLSGGIDSSLITCVASKYVSNLKTFTIGFTEQKYNESIFAKKIANYVGTKHNEYILNQSEALNYIEEIINTYDEPFADSSAIPTMIVSKLAREQVKMILCGEGGDELFLGYGSYKWAKILGNKLVKYLRLPIYYLLKSVNSNKYRRVAYHFYFTKNNYLSPQILSQELYFFSIKEINNILHKEPPMEFKLPYYPNLLDEQIIFNIMYYLQDNLLVKTDRATMKYSLEARVPFLDIYLINYTLQISNKIKLKKGLKYLSKKILRQYLPENLFNRPKWGFAIPLETWLKSNYKKQTLEVLNSYKTINLLNFNEITNVIKMFYEKNYNFLYNRIWNLFIFKMWYDKYFKA